MRNRRLLFLGLTAAVALLLAAPVLAHDGGTPKSTQDADVTADVNAFAGSRYIASVVGGAPDVDPTGLSLPSLGSLNLASPTLAGGNLTANQVAMVKHPSEMSMRGALGVLVHENLAPRVNEWHVTLKSTDLTFEEQVDTLTLTHTIDSSEMTASAPVLANLDPLTNLNRTGGSEADLSQERLIYRMTNNGGVLGGLGINLHSSFQIITLDVPEGVVAGTYTGKFTVTLYE